MNIRISKWIFSTSMLSVLLVVSQPVHAYIDPGTGSMLIQAIIAVIAASSVFLGIFWGRVKIFFRKLFGKKQAEGEHNTDEHK